MFNNEDLTQLWENIRHYAITTGRAAAQVVLELYFVMMDEDTPFIDKAIIGAILAYQFLSEDLLSREEYSWLGFVDNGVTLAFAYSRVQANITPEIEASVDDVLNDWFGAWDDDGDDGYGNGSGGGYVDQFDKRPVKVIPNNPVENPLIPPKKKNEFNYNDDEDVIID